MSGGKPLPPRHRLVVSASPRIRRTAASSSVPPVSGEIANKAERKIAAPHQPPPPMLPLTALRCAPILATVFRGIHPNQRRTGRSSGNTPIVSSSEGEDNSDSSSLSLPAADSGVGAVQWRPPRNRPSPASPSTNVGNDEKKHVSACTRHPGDGNASSASSPAHRGHSASASMRPLSAVRVSTSSSSGSRAGVVPEILFSKPISSTRKGGAGTIRNSKR
jgi:hypothetical protein